MRAGTSATTEAPGGSGAAGSDEAAVDVLHPHIRLSGGVGEDMLRSFRDQVAAAAGAESLLVELTTTGGDADVGRQIADDIRIMRERTSRRVIFLGKTVVYSAGLSIMASFDRADRWLVRGTLLLVHGRALMRTLNVDGALATERCRVQALLAEIDAGLQLEEEGFAQLIAGSDISLAEVIERAPNNWYLSAADALARRLVGRVV